MSCLQKISSQSSPAYNNALNIFSIPPTNVSINRSFFREILPLNTISQESPYLFRLFNDNLWTDLSRVYLYLELSLEKQVKNSWVRITNVDNVAPIQSLGCVFVQQLKVSIDTTEVYDSGTLYPYKTYFTNELSYPNNVKNNFLNSVGYYPSENHNDVNDKGFLARKKQFISLSNDNVEFLSRLDFDLGNQELHLINNIDVLFTIYRSRDNFLLQSFDEGVYRIFVHSVKLFVKMVDVQPSLNLTIYNSLETKPAKYSLRKTEIKSYFLTGGRMEVDHNVFSSIIPRRLTIALVSSLAFNGDIKLSPFNFQPFNIREIGVSAGGFNYPAVPYNLNFAKGSCVRAFVDMYEALGLANAAERSCDIDLQKFKNGWTFFIIPLTSTLDDSCGFELIRSGTTTVRLRFNEPVPSEGVEMVIFGEFDQLLMVDFNRRVVSDNEIV